MKKWLFIISIPVVFALMGLLTGSFLMWQLCIFSVLVIFSGYIWARFNISGIQVRSLDIPETSGVGEWFEEDIVIDNNSRLPRFGVSVRRDTDLPGQSAKLSLSFPGENSHLWKSRATCHKRGQYIMGVFDIESSDPFGILTLHRTSGTPRKLLVYPPVLDLPFFQPESYIGPGYESVRRLRNETSSTISRVREYHDGDTLNHVHWQSTAHMGTLMVKVFDTEQVEQHSRYTWIILDMNRDVQAGIGDDSTQEYGVTIASSIFSKYAESEKETGLILSGDRRFVFTPDTGSAHVADVQRALALTQAMGREPLHHLLENEMERFSSDSSVIIITPALDEKAITAVRDLRSRGCMVVIVRLDTASFNGAAPEIGKAIQHLIADGIQVYTVGKGRNIALSLDSRRISSSLPLGE